MNKLNIGCGLDYKEGWTNLDFNKNVKADIYHDFQKLPLPFKQNTFDYILMDSVLEHVKTDNFIKMIDELYRIGKNGCIIEIYVPHYSGMYAWKHPTHYRSFGVGSFDVWLDDELFNGERYSDSRFNLINEKLHFFHHNLANFKILSNLPINWLFNFSRNWQYLMERFQFLGFDELYVMLEVRK